MAGDDGYGEPTKVEVDPAKLKEEAGDLREWGTWTFGKYQGLVGMGFPVGAFPPANRLRDKLKECVDQLATNTWNISSMLETVIPENLEYSADQYIKDDDDNENEASRFNKFATESNEYGPGANNAAPATPGLPPPGNPQPVPKAPDIESD
jgi:hypothetical protein